MQASRGLIDGSPITDLSTRQVLENYMFKVHGLFSILATGMSLVCACSAAEPSDSTRATADSESVSARDEQLKSFPELPSPKLAAPEDNRLAFYYDAIGVQIYSCQATETG